MQNKSRGIVGGIRVLKRNEGSSTAPTEIGLRHLELLLPAAAGEEKR